MNLTLVQIDAFADTLFEGNPAAVMPLPHWLDDRVLQALAAENNLSETAFLVAALPDDAPAPPLPGRPALHLRWFTPALEVDLCGHATLASASYLLDDVHPDADAVQLWTRSGWLTVTRDAGGALTMDFPSKPVTPTEVDPTVVAALGGATVVEALRGGDDLVYVLPDAAAVAAVAPDFTAIGRLPFRGVLVTAAGGPDGFDFVSRWFGARAGIPEDPVTGSAHCLTAPLWAGRLGRTELVARQLSARGGTVRCRVAGERTLLSGRCVRYLEGTVRLPDPAAVGGSGP
jgi:PhzF family phenazine biosynthesis protein